MSELLKRLECKNNANVLINPKYMLSYIVLAGWIPIINIGREVRLFDILIAVCIVLYFNNFKKIFTSFFIFIASVLLVQSIYASIEWNVNIVYYIRLFELVVLVRLLSMLSVVSLSAIMMRFFWILFLLYMGSRHFGLSSSFVPDTQAIVQSLIMLAFALYLLRAKTMLANKNTILLVSAFFIIDYSVKSYIIVGIIIYIGLAIKDYVGLKSLKLINPKKYILYLFIFISMAVLYLSFNVQDKIMIRLNGAVPVAMVIYDVAESQSELNHNPLKSGNIVRMRDFTGNDSVDESFARKSARYVLLIQQLLRFPDNMTGIGLGGSNLRASESFVLVLAVEIGILLSLILVLKYFIKQYYFFFVILMFGLFNSLWYTEITIVLCMLWVVNNINYSVGKFNKHQHWHT